MATDRFISWRADAPPRSDVETLCRDYLGAFGDTFVWRDAFLDIQLFGNRSHARSRVGDVTPAMRAAWLEDMVAQVPRVIEVFCEERAASVITRMADSATNALADGIAAQLAAAFHGYVEL